MKQLGLVVYLSALTSFSLSAQNPLIIPPDSESADPTYLFRENQGQILDDRGQFREDVRFHNDKGKFDTYFAIGQVHFVAGKTDNDSSTLDSVVRIDMKFSEANINASIEGIEIADPLTNYFGRNGTTTIKGVPSYQRVQYTNIWSNIDLQFYSNSIGLKSYFILHPSNNGSTPGSVEDIALHFEGADEVELSSNGQQLIIRSPFGTIVQHAPHAFQITPSNVNNILVQFVMKAPNTIGFKLPNTTAISFPTVIQMDGGHLPQSNDDETGLLWSTYYGSNKEDQGADVVVDDELNVYLVGTSHSLSLPNNPGITEYQENMAGGGDAFIVKFNKHAALEWATFLGGNGEEAATGITWTKDKHLFVIGQITQSDLDTINQIGSSTYVQTFQPFRGIFISRINPQDGIPDWISFFGPDNSLATDIVSRDNEIFLTGYVSRQDLEANNSSTFPCDAPTNGGFPICDPGGGAYVDSTHNTGSSNLSFNSDGFISKFTSKGELAWSTFWGGDEDDILFGIEVDKINDRIYVTGQTWSQTITDNPCGVPGNSGYPLCDPGNNAYYDTTFSGINDIILAKFEANGKLMWSTFIGASARERGTSVASNYKGEVYIAGFTETMSYDTFSQPCSVNVGANGFPFCTTNNAYTQNGGGGANDNFIMKFDIDGKMKWSTLIGGEGDEHPNILHAGEPSITVDQDNNLFIAGTTYSPNGPGATSFPTKFKAGYYNQSNNADAQTNSYGVSDAYVMKFNQNDEWEWSSYFGGVGKNQGNAYGDHGIAITTIPSLTDELYIAGTTFSTSAFPKNCPDPAFNPYCQGSSSVNPSNPDAFIAKLAETQQPTNANVHHNNPNIFRIYPNPAENFVILEADLNLLHKFDVHYQIYNMLGQQQIYGTLQCDRNKSKHAIATQQLSPGIYVINIFVDGKTSSQLFVKE